jgi:hypothetical protein
VDVETETSAFGTVSVEGLFGNKLYLNSKGNSSIISVKINDIDCNFNGSVSGLDSINVSSCIENVSGAASIVVLTSDKIVESYKYVGGASTDSSSVSVSEALSIVGYNSTFGQWIGGGSYDKLHTISVDNSDNLYVGGYVRSDITDDGLGTISGTFTGGPFEGFILKFNSSGGYEWGQWIGGSSNDEVTSVSVDSLNNVYVGGFAGSDISDDGLGTISGTYSGNAEGFIFKFNSSGGYEWGQWIGDTNLDRVKSISVDSLNNVYVGGYARSDISEDGIGTISGVHSGNDEGFVFKFNSSGGYEWGQWLGNSGYDEVTSISVDSLDNVYVGGYVSNNITDDGLGTISGTYSGSEEGFVFKFNSSGGSEFVQWLGGASGDGVTSISVDSLDNVYVGGETNANFSVGGIGNISGNYSGNYEGFVLKFNSLGDYEWGQWIGATYSDIVNSISVDSLNNVYVGGYTASDITDDGLGTISGTHSGGDEGFIFKFEPLYE